jgi:hypothetical protein
MRSFLTATVALLAFAAPASAGTVAVRTESGKPVAVYTADPGQRNDVTATLPDDFSVRIHDEAATLTAGDSCKSIDDRTVECEGGQGLLHRVHVLAGDRDDVVRSIGEPHPGLAGPMSLTSPDLVADGGPGDDMLVGGDRFDRLNGGGGHDTLLGGAQTDFLSDDDTTGAADADVLDGGRDTDIISYATRTAPVTLDLGSDKPAGEAGEGDTVRGVEIARGGSGDDRLTASDEYGVLYGGAGGDTLFGRGAGDQLLGESGDDVISGGPGRDALNGGRGDDVLSGGADYDVLNARFGKDSVDCGGPRQAPPFTDGTVVDPEKPDLLTGCGDISYSLGARGMIRFQPTPVRRGGVLTLGMGCRILDPVLTGCVRTTGRLRVAEARGKRRTVARGVLHQKRDRSKDRAFKYRVRAPLTHAGRGALAHGRAPLVTVAFRDPDLPEIGWTVRVARDSR